MELKDYLRIIRRRWLSILVVVILAGAGAAAYTSLQTPVYASNARLFVSTSETDDATVYQGGQFSAQRVKSYSDLISSRELAAGVIADLGLDQEPAELAEKVTSSVGIDTVNLTLTVRDHDPKEAQRIAQSYAENLVDLVRELETPPGQRTAPIKATIVDNASFSDSPVSPNPVRNIGLGIALGLLMALGLAVLRELLDTRVRSSDDIGEVTETPVLAAIAHDSATAKLPLITQVPSHSPRAESFRVLRTNLQFVDVDSESKAIVVTSAVPEEGKTSTAVNLAISLAQGGSRTVLIECDLRRPKAAQRLGIDAAVGVTSILVGRVKFADAIQTFDPVGLDFIAAGPIPPNPAELLQSRAMADLLATANDAYDVVVIDAPPLLPVTDAALLTARADGALLVVSHGNVTRDQVRDSIERIEQVDGSLLGIVMNRVPTKRRGYGHGYGYGYGYAYGYGPESGRRRGHSRTRRRFVRRSAVLAPAPAVGEG